MMLRNSQYRGIGRLNLVLRMKRRREGTQPTGKWRTLTINLEEDDYDKHSVDKQSMEE
jgi:hypothetical protein